MSKTQDKPIGAHYAYDYRGIRIDPYRIACLYGITHPAQFQAMKKILRAGRGGHKDLRGDIRDVQDALERWLAMLDEAAHA